MHNFTRKKFLSLSFEKQHKKCAELLHKVYSFHARRESFSHLWENYLELLAWMEAPTPFSPMTNKQIADAYHAHLKKAGCSIREHSLLPNIRQGDRSKGEEPWPIAIYLDNVRSAHNVGSIIRTVEAFSLGKLYLSPSTPPAQHKQVKDAAMGAEQWISCTEETDLSALPKPMIAMETADGAIPLHDFIFPSSFTLVLGNEEYGCSDDSLHLCEYIVEIPLRGRKNSLNVANAFAIAAGEISRQKHLNDEKETHVYPFN